MRNQSDYNYICTGTITQTENSQTGFSTSLSFRHIEMWRVSGRSLTSLNIKKVLEKVDSKH